MTYNVKDDAVAQCEFLRRDFKNTPTMMFIGTDGVVVETTDMYVEKEPLRQKLDNLLAR